MHNVHLEYRAVHAQAQKSHDRLQYYLFEHCRVAGDDDDDKQVADQTDTADERVDDLQNEIANCRRHRTRSRTAVDTADDDVFAVVVVM